MSIKISNTTVIRTALLPTDSPIEDAWQELKRAIQQSSQDFFKIIKEVEANDIAAQPATIQTTIWKYFNRARYRSTPYGRFGSFSCVSFNQSNEPFIIDSLLVAHHFASWGETLAIQDPEPTMLSVLQLNATCYEVGDTLRYVAKTESGFELMEYELDADIRQVLDACRYGIKALQLCSRLYSKTNVDVLSLVTELIQAGILFCDRHPYIIGIQYPVLSNDSEKSYLISERKILSGGPDKAIFRHLPTIVNMLSKAIPPPESSDLAEFKLQFQQRFEGRFLPLSLALDPETGIDYGGLAGIAGDPLFTSLKGTDADERKEEIFKQGFRDQMQAIKEISADILDLADIIPEDWIADARLPNTMNMLVSVANGKVYLEQAGGCTATSLNGRFTLASDELLNQCKEMVDIEQEANPGVLFFDIAYMDEVHVDDINRRRQIYEHQLAILNYNTSDDPVVLSDLYVGIRDNQVVLWSKKHGKRMVPRLSSAYNFSRSSLPVFRFLCDLQFEGIHARPFFKIESVFPKQDLFPEVRYKNVVISRRKWRIRTRELVLLCTSVITCRNGLDDLGVSRYFSSGVEDQKLLFDRHSIHDLEMFIHWARNQPELLLEDAPAPGGSGITDNDGNCYCGEYVLDLFHREQVYKPIILSVDETLHPPENYIPGSVWSYIELYCHPVRVNEILVERLFPTLRALSYLVDKWFFIRYDEGGNHIRFRVKANDPTESYKIQERLIASVSGELKEGIVSDILVRVYKPEYHRYGVSLMYKVERHFCLDSEYVLTIIREPLDTFTIYRLCTKLMLRIVSSGIIDSNMLEKLVGNVLRGFEAEHKVGTVQYKRLNAIFREYRSKAMISLSTEQEKAYNQFAESFLATLNASDPENRLTLCSDIMHMHFNRVFEQQQRTFEMAWYYVLQKELLRNKAMVKPSSIKS